MGKRVDCRSCHHFPLECIHHERMRDTEEAQCLLDVPPRDSSAHLTPTEMPDGDHGDGLCLRRNMRQEVRKVSGDDPVEKTLHRPRSSLSRSVSKPLSIGFAAWSCIAHVHELMKLLISTEKSSAAWKLQDCPAIKMASPRYRRFPSIYIIET